MKKNPEVFYYYEMMKQNILDQSYLELFFCEKFKYWDFWSQF